MVDNSKALTMSREKMASYVHDIAEMEEQEFTLNKFKEDIWSRIEYHYENKKREVSTISKKNEKDKKAYEKIKNDFISEYGNDEFLSIDINHPIFAPKKMMTLSELPKPKEPKKKTFHPVTFGYILGLYIFLGIFISAMLMPLTMFIIVESLAMYSFDVNIFDNILSFIGFIILPFLINWATYCFLVGICDYKKRKKSKESYESENSIYQTNLDKYNTEHNEYLKNQLQYAKYRVYTCKVDLARSEQEKQKQIKFLNNIEKQRNLCYAHCCHISEQIEIIRNNKNSLYALDIIPPDYRTIDCAMQFDQMFRNGLVDTMRQAVLLYEERVFRGEVVRGIDNIYNMLGRLVRGMAAIESRLVQIRDEVRFMGDEVFRLTETLGQAQKENIANQRMMMDEQRAIMNSANAALLSEARATRYAAESVRDSNRRYEWYIDMRRQGLM